MDRNLEILAPQVEVKPEINANDLYDIIKNPQDSENESNAIPITTDSLFDAMHQKETKETPKEKMSWLDVMAQARQNFIPSGINMAKNLGTAVIHPLETAGGVLNLAAGGLHNIMPEDVAKWIDSSVHATPEETHKAVETANAVGKFYKERYGSGEGFKQALASDPVGVLGDLSAVLSGGEIIASKVPGLESTANALGKTAEATNPITLPFRAVSAVGKPALGLLTGTGEDTIKAAAQAGYDKDPMFWKQLTGEGDKNEPLDNARWNLNQMKQNKSNEYRSGMIDISKDKSVLDFNDIDKSLDNVKNSISFKGISKNDSAMKTFNEIEHEIQKWKNLDSTEYHTPEGLDALKQRINGVIESIPYTDKNSLRVGSEIYNSVKKTIADQAPTYANVMKDYSEASDQINEIEKALSIGDRVSSDSALKRLQSITRNNVNTNYGTRISLAEQLEREGGKKFISGLYGQALNSNTARGMAGHVEGLTTAAGFLNPTAWGAIPLQTPSLVGKALYGGGRVAKGITNITDLPGKYTKGILGVNTTRLNTLSSILNAANKSIDEEQ